MLAILVVLMAYELHSVWGRGPLSSTALAVETSSMAIWIALRLMMGLYPAYGMSSAEQLRRHTYSVFATMAIISILATAFQVGDSLSRLFLTLSFAGLLFFAPLEQAAARWGLWRLGLWGRPVVIIGYKDTSAQTVKVLREEWKLGYKPIVVFDRGLVPSGSDFTHMAAEETMSEIEDFARHTGVDTVIFAMPYTRRRQLALLVSEASRSFQHVVIIPNLAGMTNSAVRAVDLAGTFAVEIKYNLLNPWALRTKRLLDLVATVSGGVVAFSLLLILALLIYLESGRPIFHRDMRMGKDGILFSCLKFRTMVPEAENLLLRVLDEDAELKAEYAKYHKLRDDPRVTRVGRFLRKTSLDELPQLWNVLRGEMSLVGPRPYLPRESEDIRDAQREILGVPLATADRESEDMRDVLSEILRVPPGITGPWQVSGRNRATFNDRVRMDIYYVRDWSVWLDLVLLARTFKSLIVDRGAF